MEPATKIALFQENQTIGVKMHLVNITKAKYQKDYQIFLSFDDGLSGVVDLKNFLFEKKHSAFERLKDIKQFKKFLVDETLIWGDDLDLAPEYLHQLLINQNSDKNLQKWSLNLTFSNKII